MISGLYYGTLGGKYNGTNELEKQGCICDNFDFKKGTVEIQLNETRFPEAYKMTQVPICDVVYLINSSDFGLLRKIIHYKGKHCAVD